MNVSQANPFVNPQAAYKQTAVETASPEKLIIMLYAGAIKFLRQAEKALEEKRYEDAHHFLVRVGDIITELSLSLNMEEGGTIALNLRELYTFYLGEVVKANVKKDAAYLKPVLDFFETFKEVWVETAKLAKMGAK
ncbi:MAG TPA: flagellar export chaperone FliS [Peptococcaceae bacterium]|nr:flagellar export chaperone FliS [Peptococcaceae bacterium]